MVIRLTGKAARQDKGMMPRIQYELNAAPDGDWLDAFRHLADVRVTGYPRDMFDFDGAGVICPFNETRAGELLETLALYIEDANAQYDRLMCKKSGIRAERERSEARRRQTSIIVNELFEDEEGEPE